jgi:hypothetical protein
MRLDRPFLKLPIRFDAETLEREVRALPESAWVPHPTGFPGSEAVRLVTVNGLPTDAFEGPMRPTPNVVSCPYIQEVMAELGGVWGRSRLMGLGVGAEVPEHVDAHYHWRTHLRIHVPVITNPKVEFTCGGETVHMAPGECWMFDSFRWHEVHNRGSERRVHLVLDTVVTPRLWDLIDAARNGASEPKLLRPGERAPEPLMFEQFNAPNVMSPWEVRGHLAFAAGEAEPHPKLAAVLKRLDRFADGWAALWARFGDSGDGIAEYRQLIADTREELQAIGGDQIRLKNELELTTVLNQLIFIMAIANQPAPKTARLAS